MLKTFYVFHTEILLHKIIKSRLWGKSLQREFLTSYLCCLIPCFLSLSLENSKSVFTKSKVKQYMILMNSTT